MNTKNSPFLASLTPILGLLLATVACSPKAAIQGGESESDTTDAATATDGATNSSNSESATESDGDTESTDSATSSAGTGSTGGDSVSTSGAAGSTGEATGSTTGAGGSTGDATGSTSGAGSTGGVDPVDYGACPGGMADECVSHDPLCVKEFGGGTGGGGGSFSEYYSFCTQPCQTDDDCMTGAQGGSATSKCVSYQNSKICALDCSFGQSCPAGYTCELNMCMNAHCDCSGDGCQFCP